MEKNLSAFDLYTAFSSLHDSAPSSYSAAQIFNSVYSQFGSFDAMSQQNFLTFLVEDFAVFSNIPEFFGKVTELCNKLLSSDNLGSQVTALCTQTKLWLQIPLDAAKEAKFHEFVTFLFNKSNSATEIPHFRNMCSQCIREIALHKGSDFIGISSDQLLESAKQNHAPTVYSELAYSIGCDDNELKDFLDKRFWAMSPLETAMFAPQHTPAFTVPPNDPVLLRSELIKGTVPQETALSFINNPFSQFGVPQTIYGFTDSFEFDGASLLSPLDKDEDIAIKCNLLPHKMSTIDSNASLSAFTTMKSDSAIVSAVFSLASRFSAADAFAFYRRFYAETPLFDEKWIELYNNLDSQIKETIRCFLVAYPLRKSAQAALIQAGSHIPIAAIENCDKDFAKLLLDALPRLTSEAALVARKKLSEFGISNNESVSESAYVSNKAILQVDSTEVSTTDLTNTSVTVNIKPIDDQQSPLYGVCFKLEKGSIFADSGVVSLPVVNGECSITFQMKPKRIDCDALSLVCEYTAEDGTPRYFSMGVVTIESHDLLSSSDIEFKQAWSEGEESRVILPVKFQQVVAAMNKTVIGKNPNCEHEESRIQSVVSTPMGNTIAIVAVASGQQTVIHFKASSLDILAVVDIFIRTLATLTD